MKPRRTLDEISISYGTDKSSYFHNYTKLYTFYFESIRDEKLKMLEIGIDKGYSLKSWKEYFPNAEITGIDIVDLRHLEEPRVHIETGDQKDADFLKMVNDKWGPFDIIIDDGSHHNDDMKASFECLFPLVKKGGMYIVEDLHACYGGEKLGTGKPIFIDKIKELVDNVNSSGKSGCANIYRDGEEGLYNGFYFRGTIPAMNWWEKNIEFLHLYRSIVFIQRYPKEPLQQSFTRQYRKIGRNLNPVIVASKIKSAIVKRVS